MSDLLQPVSECLVSDYNLLRDACALIELTHYAVFELTGEDRKGWLQGQVTNDIRQFTPGTAGSFCLCTATGHLLGVFDAWALPDRIVLTTQQESKECLPERVESHVIVEDVVCEECTPSYALLSVQGPEATRVLSEFFTLPTLDAGECEIEGAVVTLLRSNRTGLGGWDLLIPMAASHLIARLKAAIRAINHEAFDIARLEAGVPLFGKDMNSRTFPPEMGSVFEAKHLSYTKGCYMGQEVLMRIHSRGHTNRTWMGLVAEEPFVAGALVDHRTKSEIGTVTSAGYSPDFGYIGGAMIRNEFAIEGVPVFIRAEEGSVVEAETRRMPFLGSLD